MKRRRINFSLAQLLSYKQSSNIKKAFGLIFVFPYLSSGKIKPIIDSVYKIDDVVKAHEKLYKNNHVGKVILEEGVEIGANSTIDRGSLTDTIIGKNTFLDNQVHVAHNVQIGKNCMVAGQVGFAGSTIIGDNVVIGGQAGISGHLKIGNNVKIGGGSGVINNISDNHQVMGYPAVPLKEFVKQRKK